MKAAAQTRAAVRKNIRDILMRRNSNPLLISLTLSLCYTNVSHAQSAPVPTPLLVDRDMSAGAGATVTLAVARLVAHGEDRFVPLRLFEDKGKLRHGTNATYRLAKLALFDEPQENWFRIVNHEVFGHGGRVRELFGGPVGYRLPAPPPYGRGGGATFFEFDRTPTAEELLAVSVGGMEANYVMARDLAKDAVTEGRWHYRDARRYLYAEYDTIRYIRGTHNLETEGHDVGDFLRVYNYLASHAHEKRLSARMLKKRALVSFANPMIAYSYYSTFISYVWGGHTSAPVPMIHLGGTRYLPMARFHLTSFGAEFVIDNMFVRNGRFVDIKVTAGQTIGARTWGIGLQGTRLASFRRWTIDGEGYMWRRPEWGEDVSVTTMRPLAQRGTRSIALVVQGGFKTASFAPGDRLHRGAFARVGAVFIPALIPTSRQSP